MVSRINSLAQFAGPLRLNIERDIDIEEGLSEELQSLAVALAAPHRATIMLRLHFFPLKDLKHLMMDTKCQAFARITSLSINDPLVSPPTLVLRPATQKSHPVMPQFPMLTHLALHETWSIPASIQDARWSWLFDSSICNNLLSFSAYPIRGKDVLWLLLRTPRLLDLRVSTNTDTDNWQGLCPIITHQNLEKLSLGFGYSSPTICCPNLRTLTCYLRTLDDNLPAPPKLDPTVNLTTLGLREVENVITTLHSLRPNLSALTTLYIPNIGVDALSEFVHAVQGDHLPNLSHLWLHLSRASPHPSSPLFSVANSLRQLAAEHKLLTIDCRISKYVVDGSTLLHLANLLRGAPDRNVEDISPGFDDPFDLYSVLLSFDLVLDAKPQVRILSLQIQTFLTVLVRNIRYRWARSLRNGPRL